MKPEINAAVSILEQEQTKIFKKGYMFNREFYELLDKYPKTSVLKLIDYNSFNDAKQKNKYDVNIKYIRICTECSSKETQTANRRVFEEYLDKYKKRTPTLCDKCKIIQDKKDEQQMIETKEKQQMMIEKYIDDNKEAADKFKKIVSRRLQDHEKKKINFGQHKGKFFYSLATNYLKWIIRNYKNNNAAYISSKLELLRRGELDYMQENVKGISFKIEIYDNKANITIVQKDSYIDRL